MEVPAAPPRGVKAAQPGTVGRILETGNGPTKTSCFTQKTIFQDKYPQGSRSGRMRNGDGKKHCFLFYFMKVLLFNLGV